MAKALQISSIPTLLLIKPNTPPQRTIGYMEKAELEKNIKEILLDQKSEE